MKTLRPGTEPAASAMLVVDSTVDLAIVEPDKNDPCVRWRDAATEAADRVRAVKTPGRTGLKEFAEEAGVSHALVTDDFGTFDHLAEETRERRSDGARSKETETVERANAPPTQSVGAHLGLTGLLVDLVADKTTIRLIMTALSSGNASRQRA